jgi:D-alanyl-D-alanine carboxypeptidase
MNKKAEELAMESSYFSNPSGLDFEDNDINYSSANDLLKLVVYILKEHPKIGEILSLKQYNLYSQNGYFHHHLLNTNQMLEENNTLWGKTGSTLRAKDCLINLTKKDDYFIIITIVLGAGDKFEETRKLNTWIDSAFLW